MYIKVAKAKGKIRSSMASKLDWFHKIYMYEILTNTCAAPELIRLGHVFVQSSVWFRSIAEGSVKKDQHEKLAPNFFIDFDGGKKYERKYKRALHCTTLLDFSGFQDRRVYALRFLCNITS